MASPREGTANPAVDYSTAARARADGGGSAERADEVGPEAPIPPAEVAELFAALDKAIRARRLYQSNNPVYGGFITAVQSAITNLWDGVPSLTASVEETAFRWYGRAFTAGEGRESMPFLFYRDGIRFITLLPGFEDEVERFMDVVNRVRGQDQRLEDDLVTLLWQEQFSSFQYSYVDALAEGTRVPQATMPKLAGIELTLVEDDAAGRRRSDSPPPPAVQEGKPTVAGLVNRDDFEETLYFLDQAELAELHREVEREWSRDLKTDVLNGLFDRLEDGRPDWRSESLRILRQMLPVFMGGGDLQSASRIVVELGDMLEHGKLAEEYATEAQQLFRELSEPAVLTQFMRSLEDGSIDPSSAELGVFLEHLGPRAMPVLLASIERTQVPELQDRLRPAMEGLAAAHRQELLALLGDESSPEVLRGATRLAGQLGIVEAAARIRELLARPDAPLRRVAVEALARIRNSVALEGIQSALDDDDRDVRLNAARALATLRYPPARGRLEEMLESRIVREADLTEKIAFFEAYGGVATAENVAFLDRMLNGRRLFGKESAEMRACAAMALGRVGSPAAREALQRASGEANPIIRNAVQKALREERA